MTALKRADSLTPQTSTTVMSATMSTASALKTIGTPKDVRGGCEEARAWPAAVR